jgi:plastocyanin
MRLVERRHLPALFAVVALLVTGCGSGSDLPATSSSTDSAGAPASASGTVSVVMKSLDFSPSTVHARVGQTVTWTNEDEAPHNVTYISGPRFRSSQRQMPIGKRFSIHLTEAGTIHYVCTLHPWMRASVIVSG